MTLQQYTDTTQHRQTNHTDRRPQRPQTNNKPQTKRFVEIQRLALAVQMTMEVNKQVQIQKCIYIYALCPQPSHERIPKKIEFQKNIDAIQPLPMFWLFQYTCFLFLLAGSNYSLIKFWWQSLSIRNSYHHIWNLKSNINEILFHLDVDVQSYIKQWCSVFIEIINSTSIGLSLSLPFSSP